MARPAEYPLSLYRGDSYTWRFRFWNDELKTIPTDFDGATAEAEVRNRSAGDEIMTLTCSIGGVDGNEITVELPVEQWENWSAGSTGTWDLQVTFASGAVITYVVGPVDIDGDVVDSVALGSGSSAGLSRAN